MSKNVTPRVQFTLGELLSTVVMTFIGVLVLAPVMRPLPQEMGMAASFIGTWGAALLAVYSYHSTKRILVILCCILAGWTIVALIPRLSDFPDIVIVFYLVTVPFIISFALARQKKDSEAGSANAFGLGSYVLGACVIMLLCVTLFTPPRYRNHGYTAAAAACKAFVEAEEIYHRTDYNGDGVLEYAQAMTGQTSLSTNNGVEIALVDRAFAAAEQPITATPKAGYYFRVLKTQGPNAPGGAYSYIENGRMTKGYALIAFPAEYEVGRDCFMISHTGTIYQADLGANTTQIASTITQFDPIAPMWTPTE